MDNQDKPLYIVPNNLCGVRTDVAKNFQQCEPTIIKKYGSADEFLKDISYGGDLYPKLNNSIVFRGLQSGTYELIPSVLRNKIKFTNLDGSEYVVPEDSDIDLAESEENQRFKEYHDLRTFFELSDENSLKLPDIERIRKSLLSYKDFGSTRRLTDEWIPYDLHELAALAQHYGLKTRLLDWTTNIDTAIYFAVHEDPILKEDEMSSEEAKFVVIWLLDTSITYKIENLIFIRPPYYGNPNLAAQKGLFTCWVEPGFRLSSNVISEREHMNIMSIPVNRTPLDKRIKEELKGESVNKTYMWKLMIPREDRKELYEYINRKGVNAASLFPGYGGVVKCIQETRAF